MHSKFLLVLLIMLAIPAFGFEFVLDDFAIDANADDDTDDNVAVTATTLNVGELGATRVVSVNLQPGSVIDASIDINSGANIAALSQGVASNAIFNLNYDLLGNTQNVTNRELVLDFFLIEGGTIFQNFIVDIDGSSFDFATALNDGLGLDGNQGDLLDVVFNLDLDLVGVSTADIIDLQIQTATDNSDIAFQTELRVVPEPSTYFVFGLLGILGLIYRRRQIKA